ncbi:baculoviral IAP repeat-containing 2/3/4 [Exophiala viscosa]|uniref:Baculoviral IAP repeat-containing 2/3/4 n=1 Tax=Exophiala viscosa TaxID=2486360 RepID=A0AAN6IHG0_9EURO|nr:baculoviral IAP repeat-containing 2/3/4 [Exophiala viscosa]
MGSTYESRLATFEPPSKRSKLGWPHKTPTPEELARAGFYYKPSKESNDNTECYLCQRSLNGWEPDDDPVQEHLKHASDCGWVILMDAVQNGSIDVDAMEDPTGQHFAQARTDTFSIGWPHEGKRGWTCKIRNMVEAGWYYAPTPDSEDYVSCAHCKLSLDGWEPKDNPFDEHYRRSPACPFFHFAGTTAPSKRPKAKKGRASRASNTSRASSRLSTQSQNATMLSEATSITDIPDLDESIDTSTTSVMSTMSTASTTKGKRKGAGGKAKTTKSKRAKTTKSTRSKKGDAEAEPEATPEETIEADAEETPTQQTVAAPIPTSIPQALPSPAPSPPADITYPPIANSPSIMKEILRLSPLGAPPHPSPTPMKTRAPPSSTRSKATSRPATTPRTATRSHPAAESPVPTSPSPPSDIENAPPSSRPGSARAPMSTQKVPLAASSPGEPMPTWESADIELLFQPTTPQPADLLGLTGGTLSNEEKAMPVQDWIGYVAGQAEASLRAEAERVVGIFEREGQRAMGVLAQTPCV